MTITIERRQFISALGAAAVAWPLAARAQQPAMPTVGFLNSGASDTWTRFVIAFRQGLKEAGYVENHNVVVEYRWANGRYDDLPALASELVQLKAAVIIATGGMVTAVAAKKASSAIPIVFVNGSDPIKFGLVSSFNRPGGNVTGVSFLTNQLEAKRLELLHEVIPSSSKVALLVNPNNADVKSQLIEVQSAARSLGLEILVLNALTESDIEMSFATLIQQRAGALLVGSDALLFSRRAQLVALAARHAIPAIYMLRDFVSAGGLMSYGTSVADAYRLAGTYVGRILKGEKVGDLPVQESVRVELVINLKAGKALGLTFPITLLGRADEVIE
jgi:putative ABC transport system substrate-binding protein